MNLKPLATEKAVMKIETENVMTFVVSQKAHKDEIKKEIEELFNVKVQKVRTLIRGGKKYVYVQLKKQFPAIDLATKLGMI